VGGWDQLDESEEDDMPGGRETRSLNYK